MQVNAFRPAHRPKLVSEGRHARLDVAVALGKGHQNTDLSRARFLLRARRERPRDGRAAEQRDELAPFHSMTSSAMASTPGAKVRPSAAAVFKLITSSNLVGCSTGKSAGLTPLNILST